MRRLLFVVGEGMFCGGGGECFVGEGPFCKRVSSPTPPPPKTLVLEHVNFEKGKCSNAARTCSAPQRGVDSGENHVFRQNDTLKQGVFQKAERSSRSGGARASSCDCASSQSVWLS
ncbi:conserved protein of unknown function [Desulfovibrio sp. 86]|nr:conserved protein of unknown function [Desulfovibrio sp. 86]